MKKVLLLAAVSEAATGLALLIVPSLVGRLLLGAELSGVSIPVARVTRHRPDRLGRCLLAWSDGALRHADLQRAGNGISRLPRHSRPLGRAALVAGRRVARCPDDSSRPRLAHEPKDRQPRQRVTRKRTIRTRIGRLPKSPSGRQEPTPPPPVRPSDFGLRASRRQAGR